MKERLTKSLVVAGVMSGTSVDGVDVAVCRISPATNKGGTPRVKLLGHVGVTYPKDVRAAVLSAMDADAISVAELARLNWRLGEVYADAVEKAQSTLGVKIELIGCHGQTVYHQGTSEKYLGRALRVTWQMGEASVIAERLRVPVVSDFRPADVAAGGQGAPLVPMLDYVMFRSATVSRVLLNLGGIANLTAIPASAGIDGVIAFDTGPGNMVIDDCMRRLYDRAFDRGGVVAQSGNVLKDVVEEVLKEGYFSALPPKSCGREQFGEAFVSRFVAMCRKAGGRVDRDEDVVATATALTAASILDAYRRFVLEHVGSVSPVEFVVAGGGANNNVLMGTLQDGLKARKVKVRTMEELGSRRKLKKVSRSRC